MKKIKDLNTGGTDISAFNDLINILTSKNDPLPSNEKRFKGYYEDEYCEVENYDFGKRKNSKKNSYDGATVKDMSYMFNGYVNRVDKENTGYFYNELAQNLSNDRKMKKILNEIENKNNIFFLRIKNNFDNHMAKLVETYLSDKSHENRQIIIKYINLKQNI